MEHAAHELVAERIKYIGDHPCHPDNDHDQRVKEFSECVNNRPEAFMTTFRATVKDHGPIRSIKRLERNIQQAMVVGAPNFTSTETAYNLEMARREAHYIRRCIEDFIMPKNLIRFEDYDNE